VSSKLEWSIKLLHSKEGKGEGIASEKDIGRGKMAEN